MKNGTHTRKIIAGLAVIAGISWFVLPKFAHKHAVTMVSDPDQVEVVAPRTTDAERAEARRRQLEDVIKPGLQQTISPEHFDQWTQVLSAIKWSNYRAADAIAPMRELFASSQLPEELRRSLFETAYGQYPDAFADEMGHAFETERDTRLVAMAGAYLLRMTPGDAERMQMRLLLEARFPEWATLPRILALHHELCVPRQLALRQRPELRDLLSAPFDGRAAVFSLQRLDRQWCGRAIVRGADGEFLRRETGSIWSVPHFARSVSDLPGTISNGNTPQGIFEIRGIGHAKNVAIGPTETLVLGLPGEYDATWTEARYDQLLPQTWRAWWPIKEAWWAGQAGRYEILAHGTTIDPEFWRDEPFYPNTPSHGCLTSPEQWNGTTGVREDSDQLRLVRAFQGAGGAPGWLVLIEIDAAAEPVSEEVVESILRDGK
ncbi:MAG: hypothetical protein O3C21_05965 [Verrucomicrobia bacterium]|nr:hypothetical protein [Verrucomicrobiota bacterium]